MSRVSIYENGWIDLVFENRNKEYGAYELRRNSVKSSLTAFLIGLLFVASLLGTAVLFERLKSKESVEDLMPDLTNKIIQVTNLSRPVTVKTILPQIKSTQSVTSTAKDIHAIPIVVHPNEATLEVPKNSEITNAIADVSAGTSTIGTNTSGTSGIGTEITNTVDYGTTIVNTVLLDKLPEFPGGIKKFYSYVGNNFEKPEIDNVNTYKIFVSFVIEKDGSMTDIQVKRDPGYGLGQEAIRVLKSLKTKWTPGIIDSKPVRTSYNLPISIEMN